MNIKMNDTVMIFFFSSETYEEMEIKTVFMLVL